jgi:archaellum component FlaC
LKKLSGNRDIEDSLERLDKLTQEEARMASAELLKMAHSVDDKVMGVDDRVKGVEGQVQDVRDDVQGVGNVVQSVEGRVRGDVQDVRDDVHDVRDDVHDVRDDVQDVRDKVQDVDDSVQDIGKDISFRVQGVDDKLDQANRSLFLLHPIVPTTQTTSQGSSSETNFCDGYRPQIHPPIITSHPKLITTVQLNGFFEEVYSVNGNQRAPSCGYTENVRYLWLSPLVKP